MTPARTDSGSDGFATGAKHGRRLVKMVWSGVAGPIRQRASASREAANSSTGGASSKKSTCRRLLPTSPRTCGATASATRRRTSAAGLASATPPKRGRPFARWAMASSARLISWTVAS